MKVELLLVASLAASASQVPESWVPHSQGPESRGPAPAGRGFEQAGRTQAAPAPPGPGEAAEERGLRASAEGAFDGFSLVAPLRSTDTFLVDASGEVKHTWPSKHGAGNSVYLLDDGSILRCCKEGGESPFRGGGQGGRIQRIAWDGELLWDYSMASESWRHHHDIEPLPSGNVLAIVWEGLGRDDALRLGRDADDVGEAGLWPDAVIELKPVGKDGAEVVWEWHSKDHLVQDRSDGLAGFGKVAASAHRIDVNFDRPDRPKTAEELEAARQQAARLRALGYGGGDETEEDGEGKRPASSDWMHTNGIDYDAESDLIALSVREASEVWIIDHSTTTEQARTSSGGRRGRGGDLVYRFGNPKLHGGKGQRQLFHQHDARFVRSAGTLSISVFNNGEGRKDGDRSTSDIFALPFTDADGFQAGEKGQPAPAELRWSWGGGEGETLFNGHICGTQVLPTGNVRMSLGEDGRVIEVTPGGEVVWDYLQPFEPNVSEERGGRRGGPGGDRGGRGERGGPPPGGRGERGGPPGDGPPRGRRGEGRGGRGPGGGGQGPMSTFAVFRFEAYAKDHPGLARIQ